jgi:hypothetical protein
MVITMPGLGGGIIRYPLEITKAPSENARLKLTNPLPSTYASDTSLRGEKSKKVSVTAPKGAKIKVSNKGDQFLWQFPSPNSGSEQEFHLIVKEDDQEFSAFHTMYRGYSRELSIRLAGVLSSQLQMTLLTEVAYNQWFETLFGWENALLSKQRWGVSARHLSTIKSFSAQGANVTDLNVRHTTVDLKYRLTPGLWERDETWGLIVGGEDITINRIRGSFLGAGCFWARSMPRVFDSIFNWFPYMSYPKWVDMEILYYFVPMSSSVKNGSSPTYAVNFHGKIMWTKNFFGEAGFGVKAYSYEVNLDGVTVQALYGTAGLGFNF